MTTEKPPQGTPGLGCLAVPAFNDEPCPKCQAINRPGVAYVWRLSDKHGLHWECTVCAHAWR